MKQPRRWERQLGLEDRDALQRAIAQQLPAQRWFGSKTRTLERVTIEDTFVLSDTAAILLIRVTYTNPANEQTFVLPLTVSPPNSSSPEASPRGVNAGFTLLLPGATDKPPVTVSDALHCGEACRQILAHLAAGSRLLGAGGELVFVPGARLAGKPVSNLPSGEVLRAEQSNTSVSFADTYVLKVFRRLESGTQPELEVSAHLTARGFRHTPTLEGHIEYCSYADARRCSVAVLQSYVANHGDAWEYAAEQLRSFVNHLSTKGANKPSVTNFVGSARKLGHRTAELHSELAADGGDPVWQPEAYDKEALHSWSDGALVFVERAFRLLGQRLDQLSPASRALCERVRSAEEQIGSLFAEIPQHDITVHRIRCHGDYHLGQVLWTGDDFIIIDFEGEPTRSFEERRRKHCALRDVASMVRSFHYATCFAASQETSAARSLPPALFREWYDVTRRAFLDAYRSTAAAATYVPQSQTEWDWLMRVQLLEKAVYELDYELNHRPDWVSIPAAGILQLVDV